MVPASTVRNARRISSATSRRDQTGSGDARAGAARSLLWI
jgi:hypothetical protein